MTFSFFQIQHILRVGRPRAGPLYGKSGRKWAGPGPFHFQICLNFWSWKKKGFRLKNIFFFAFYERLSFFDGKYGYFSTFDQQISAENLVFRFLYCPFTKCLILANFLSKFWAEGSFQIKEQVASLPGVEISVDKKNFHFSPPRDAKQCRMMRTI